jgi:hypothetical protein
MTKRIDVCFFAAMVQNHTTNEIFYSCLKTPLFNHALLRSFFKIIHSTTRQ